MRAKLLCAISLLLNVALAGYWLKSRVSLPAPLPASVVGPTNAAPPVRVVFVPGTPQPIPEVPSPVPEPSAWSRIESADYPVFIANLRATGCPESTIRDIVAREIDKLRGKKPSTPAPQEDTFWMTTADRESRNRSRRLAELELKGERRALLKALLGVEGDWPQCDLARPSEWAGLCALLTPPTFEAAEEMAWVFDRMEFERERIETVAGSPLKLSEIEELGRLRDDSLAKIVGLVGQPRVDETLGLVRVALMAIEQLDFLGSDDPKKRFSESELRSLAVAQPPDVAVVDDAFGFEEVTRLKRFRAGLPRDASAENKAAFLESVAPVLGEERARELRARAEPSWSQAEEFVREKQLPVATAEMLVEARSLANAEAGQIRRDPAFSAEEEMDRLRRIGGQLRTALGEALPPDVWLEYLSGPGAWIEAIERGTEDDE